MANLMQQERQEPAASPGSGAGRRTGKRLDIQGLRAIAVLLVVLYHAGAPVLTGGFVGVDVFYGISGFLIVGLILTEVRDTGRVGLLAFWGRRLRRLLPASLLVLLVTILAARLFLPPAQMATISGDATATALYVANIHFALNGTDYLSSDVPSPFQHYWSLALEEQFYVFLPLLVALIACFTKKRAVRTTTWILALGALASFVACVAITSRSQPVAFFTLPTRAWELALGGLAAVAVHRFGHRLNHTFMAVLGWAGLAAVLVASTLYTDDTVFPGWHAAVPVVGAVALLSSGAVVTGRLQAALGWRPLRYVGDISYSLYLWHWPVLVLPALAVRHDLNGFTRAGLVIASFALAVLSYRLIENPARHWTLLARNRRLTYGAAAVLTAAAVGVSAAAGITPRLDAGRSVTPVASGVVPEGYAPAYVPSNATPGLQHASADASAAAKNGCLIGFLVTAPKTCDFGDKASDSTVVLFGDSHAEVWVSPLQRLAKKHGFRLVTMLKASCPAAEVLAQQTQLNRPFTECTTWRANALREIAALHPTAVIATDLRDQLLVGDNSPATRERGMRKVVTELTSTGTPVYWIGDGPDLHEDVPLCLSANLDNAAACSKKRSEVMPDQELAGERSAVEAGGGTWVDAPKWLCPGQTCPTVFHQYVMYRDFHHLTATYARSLAPALWKRIKAGITGS